MTTTKATTTATAALTSSQPCGCGCGCQEHGVPTEGCCKLTCFERPAYFCGQLLSDADLTLQETYFREKNKLYHRALDGFGVVCGLRMQCDCHCKGHIIIGDGYAIDCCGNDLVVCEPRSFDVIGELRKKKWLVEIPRDPCRERDHPRDQGNERDPDEECISKHCYYIGICYAEEPSNYVAPYTTECSPAPGPCQPTRIREGVRFEIYDKPPCRPNPLDEIEKRIERCFRIFREGAFSKGLEQIAPGILEILSCGPEKWDEPPRQRAHQSFSELQGLFLHQLRICPDQYNCDLEHEVCKIRPPSRDGNDQYTTPREAFTRLLELIQKYVFSCVLAQFAFPCPEPPDPCCVLIGSVEVVNGRLTRVINYPRWYLWCFANFFEVLIYTLANEAACPKDAKAPDPLRDEPLKRRPEGCCPEFEVDVCEFLNLFVVEKRASEYAALTSLRAFQAVHKSLVAGFDFMKPHGVAPAVFNHLPLDSAQKIAKAFGFSLEAISEPGPGERDVFSAFADNAIHRGGDPLVYKSEGNEVTSATRLMGGSARAVGPFTYQYISDLQQKLENAKTLEARLEKCEAEIAALRKGETQ